VKNRRPDEYALDGLCASLLGLSANSRRRHYPVGQVR